MKRRQYVKQEVDECTPEARLIVAIIARAGQDVRNGNRAAVAFVQSADFDYWCDWIGVRTEKLRSRILESKK